MRKTSNQQLVTVEILEKTLDKRFEQFGRQIVSELIEYIDVRVGAIEEKQNDMAKTLDWLVGAYSSRLLR